jgi:hypothetical protein
MVDRVANDRAPALSSNFRRRWTPFYNSKRSLRTRMSMQISGEREREYLSSNLTMLKGRFAGNRGESRKYASIVVRRCSGARRPRKINTGAKRHEPNSPIRVKRRN